MEGLFSTRVQKSGRLCCLIILLLVALLAACAGQPPIAVNTATATAETAELITPPTPTPPVTPSTIPPTATSLPEPTLTPSPTATSEPTQAPTPEPVLTEAQIETQKVVEYVAANSEVINRVPMEHVEFRATNALQQQIYDRLPADLQALLGNHPLYMMVWNAPKMQEVLSGLSIEVEGYEHKLSLADYKLVVTFMNFNEEMEGVTLEHYHGGATDSFVYGAYLDEDTGEIHLAMRSARIFSAGYDYGRRNEVDYVFQGMIPALARLTNSDHSYLYLKLSEDTIYDDAHYFPEDRGVTSLVIPGVGNPYRESGTIVKTKYLTMEFYRLLYEQGWIPPEAWELMQ